MTTETSCLSCGMPLTSPADHARGDEDIPYCAHCTTESGELQPFEERFDRMTQWSMRKDGLDRAAAGRQPVIAVGERLDAVGRQTVKLVELHRGVAGPADLL